MRSPSRVDDNTWHHAVLTTSTPAADGTRTQYLYVDGQPVSSTTSIIDMLDMTSAQFGRADSGYWEAGCTGMCSLPGVIGDAAIYNHPLEATRVAAHYQAGQNTLTSPANGTGTARDGRFTLDGTPRRIRIDTKTVTGSPAGLTLTATPTGGGSPITLDATRLAPNYGLTTSTTTEDSNPSTPAATPSMTSSTSYSDAATGIDPVLGLATAGTVDPAGLALTTRTGYEPYTSGSLLRRTTRTLPSGAATAITSSYYGNTETRTNPCPAGGAALQSGLAKATTQAAPATGPAIAGEVVYDVMGRPVAVGNREGQATPANWTCTSYDTRGRPTHVTVPPANAPGNAAPERTIITTYPDASTDGLTTTVLEKNSAGQVTSTNTATTDLLGRTTSYSHTVPGATPTSVLATITTTTSYDTAGRASQVTTSSSTGGTSTTTTGYLTDGRVDTLTVDGTQLAKLTYDPTSKDLAWIAYATGSGIALTSITKNDTGAVTGQAWTLPGSSRTLTDTVIRSRAGRITTATTTDSATRTDTWTYGYDTAGRLATAVLAAAGARPQLSLGYGYAASGGCGTDPNAGLNGSRTTTTRQLGTGATQTSSWCTDGASRLTSITSTTGGLAIPASSISYDTHGNATRIGTQTWTYDGADRVTGTATIDLNPTTTLTYTRDSLGRVIARTATSSNATLPAGEAPRTLYGFSSPDDSPDYQLNPTTGALTERYLTLPGGILHTRPITATGATGTWAIGNLHGDITATITTPTTGPATITSGYLNEPYGQPLNPTTGTVDTGATPTTRGNTGTTDPWHGTAQRGYEHTSGLNQTLMGARTYLPALGLFTATDPIEGGNTTTYTYPQDPINESDLNGNTSSFRALKIMATWGYLPGVSGMAMTGEAAGFGGGGGRAKSPALVGCVFTPMGKVTTRTVVREVVAKVVNPKRLSNPMAIKFAKGLGQSVEEFKESYVGVGAKVSRYDLYRDRSGKIWVISKDGRTRIETYESF